MPNKHGNLRITEQVRRDESGRILPNRSLGESEIRYVVLPPSLHDLLGIKEEQIQKSKYHSNLVENGYVLLIRSNDRRAIRIHTTDINGLMVRQNAHAYHTAIKHGWKHVIVSSYGFNGVYHPSCKLEMEKEKQKQRAISEKIVSDILSDDPIKRMIDATYFRIHNRREFFR